MTKLYTTTNGKTCRLDEKQFRGLAKALYGAAKKGKFTAVVVLSDNPDDSLVCYQKKDKFACQRRAIMPLKLVSYGLPLVLSSPPFYPVLDWFIGMLYSLPDCTVEVYDSNGIECKKVFNLRGA